MAGLELRFLGDFEVRRDGRAVPLPPSKKTRVLLAYLCLQPRRFSREQLCQLLWEVPDDPRGSLRWSLSKLRHLLDDKERCAHGGAMSETLVERHWEQALWVTGSFDITCFQTAVQLPRLVCVLGYECTTA